MFIRTLFITAGLTLGLASFAAADNNNRNRNQQAPTYPRAQDILLAIVGR